MAEYASLVNSVEVTAANLTKFLHDLGQFIALLMHLCYHILTFWNASTINEGMLANSALNLLSWQRPWGSQNE